MMAIHTQNQAGFSLIEVLIAITIFAIGILGVAAMQTMATGGNTVAMTTTELTTLAAQQMEELMALPFIQLGLDTNGDGEAGLGNVGNPAIADPATGAGGANVGKADYEIQRGDIIISANVAQGVPVPIPLPLGSSNSGTTTIRVIATKLNANLDKVIRTVTLDSVSSIGTIH